MKIVIETIPHRCQRYDTVGDYWTDPDGTWQLRISDLGNWHYEFLVALHELVEKALCVRRGITDQQIDRFDMSYTEEDIEPGDHPESPYWKEHQEASGIERLMAALLGVSWIEYDTKVDSMPPPSANTLANL